MSKRSFVLEQLDHLGVRTYIPPPNCLILEMVDKGELKTKHGVLLPEVWSEAPSAQDGSQETAQRKKPLGHVLAVSMDLTGDYWPKVGAPCMAGDYVLFSGAMGLITEIEPDMYVMNLDCVSLTIREGAAISDGETWAVVHEPVVSEKVTTLYMAPGDA